MTQREFLIRPRASEKASRVIKIRKEDWGDEQQIHKVNREAFGRDNEADLVDQLRQSCPDSISLVALSDDRMVGHILFTPVVIEGKEGNLKGMGLAPMAVLPEFQNQGIGSQLVRAGLAAVAETQSPFVVVLGHPTFYPRFGFVPASRYGIVSEYEGVPDEAFMILVLTTGPLEGVSGVARYRPEFSIH